MSTKNRWRWILLVSLLVLGSIVGLQLAFFKNGPDNTKKDEKKKFAGPPLYQDVTGDSGIKFGYQNDFDGKQGNHFAILDSLGGGLGLIDVYGDLRPPERRGLLDIFVAGGGYYDGPDKKTIKGLPCKLFKNMGNFKFKDVTKEVGLDKVPAFYNHGVAVCDYDRDGWPDILLTGYGRLALYRNVPDPKDPKNRMFVDVTKEVGLLGEHFWSTSAAWADFDGDGFPDLYVCQYVDWSWENNPVCGGYHPGAKRDICPPKQFKARRHAVYRNDGKGHFIDVTREAGIAQSMGTMGFLGAPLGQGSILAACGLFPDRPPGIRILRDDVEYGKGLGVVVVDVNGDRLPDIYVANDTVDNFLYINKSKPGFIQFDEVGLQLGVARDDQGSAQGSMGTDAADPFGTGWPSLWCTNYELELHALYQNRMRGGNLYFNFATQSSGLAAIGQTWVGFGTGFLDIDNDGWEDLFISNGHVIRYPGGAAKVKQKPVMFLNYEKIIKKTGAAIVTERKFQDISEQCGTYFLTEHQGRGVAIGDLNNDGLPDIVVSHVNAPIAILKNVSPAGNNWLGIELKTKDNRTLTGAKLILEVDGRTLTRFAKGGGSYMSANDTRHIFGLAKAAKSGKLTIEWPTGEPRTEHWENLQINKYHRLVQGSGTR
jgi:hypothetical protein